MYANLIITFRKYTYNDLNSNSISYDCSMNIRLSNSWGYMDSEGTFDGIVGALENREIDFGLSPLFVRSDRAQHMEYGRLTWVLRYIFSIMLDTRKKQIKIILELLLFSVILKQKLQ